MESPNPAPGPGCIVKDEPGAREHARQANLGGDVGMRSNGKDLSWKACAGFDEQLVVSANGMSVCDEFHSSLDELRRVSPTDQVGPYDSIRELLRHWDMIMLNIAGEREPEHDSAADDGAQVAGILNSCSTGSFSCCNSLPDPTIQVEAFLTGDQSLFYEKKRFMDFTSCLTPEETNEMYDQGRMQEICCKEGGTGQVGLLDEIAGEERFLESEGGNFRQGTGDGRGPEGKVVADALFSYQNAIMGTPKSHGVLSEQIEVDAILANTDAGEATKEGDAAVSVRRPLLPMEKRVDKVIPGRVSRTYAGQQKAGRSKKSTPIVDHLAMNDYDRTGKDKEGSRQRVERRYKNSASSHRSDLLRQERGTSQEGKRKSNSMVQSEERGWLDAHKKNTDQVVKEEVVSEHEDLSVQLRSSKRKCRQEGLAEDVRCRGTQRKLCNVDTHASGVNGLKQDPKSTVKGIQGTGSRRRHQHVTTLSCKPKRGQGINQERKSTTKREKATRTMEVDESPSTKQLATNQFTLLHNECSLLTGTPASLQTRVWRPKLWSQEHRFNTRGAAEVPATTEFPQSHSPSLEVATACSSKQDNGAAADHVICLLNAESAEVTSHPASPLRDGLYSIPDQKGVSCLAEVINNHLQAEHQTENLVRHKESKGMNGRSVYCQSSQGMCRQGTKPAAHLRIKELHGAHGTFPCEISSARPLFAAPRWYDDGCGLDDAITPLCQDTNQSSSYQGSRPFYHTMSNQAFDIAASQSPPPVLPQQVPDDSITDQIISNPGSRFLRNSREFQTKLNERLQSHDSNKCAMALERCGPDQQSRGESIFQTQFLELTSSQLSFEHAQYAIDHGLQNEHDFNGIRVIHLLMSCVEALCRGDEGVGLAEVLLARVKEMVDVRGYPLQRVAAHFTTGLKLAFGVDIESSSQAAFAEGHLGGASQVLHEVLPYIKFVHFTANQALLEAFEGKQEMHILDYDIMDGMQWPPLMHALATARDEFPGHQENSANNQYVTTPTKLKITAVCRGQLPRNSMASSVSETGRRLEAFAKSLDLQFEFQVVQEPQRQEETQALEEGWQKIFLDLGHEQKPSPYVEILRACGGSGREGHKEGQTKHERKAPTKGNPSGNCYQVPRKSVQPKSLSKQGFADPAQTTCVEEQMRVETEKLKSDLATDPLHDVTSLQAPADHELASQLGEQGQVQVIQDRSSPPPQLGKITGSARGRRRARKLNLAGEDETDLRVLPLKPEDVTIPSSPPLGVYMHEMESPSRKPARWEKVATPSSKWNKRLQTQAPPSKLDAGSSPTGTLEHLRLHEDIRRSAQRLTAETQLLADNAQGQADGARKFSETTVRLNGDSVLEQESRNRKFEQDTGVRDQRLEKVPVRHSEDGVGRSGEICGTGLVRNQCANMNQFLHHVDHHPESAANMQRITPEELQMRSQKIEEGEKALKGGRAVDEWEGVVSGRREKTVENWLRSSGSNKAQHYSRRNRLSERNSICHAPKLSGAQSDKPVEKPAYRGIDGTRHKAGRNGNLGMVATRNELQQTQHKTKEDQAIGNGETPQSNKANSMSPGTDKHFVDWNPDKCVAVNCMVHLPHMAHRETESVNSFLAAAARFSPLILTVGEDGMNMTGTEDFVSYFCEGLYHFCAFSDSLEASLSGKKFASAVVEQLFCSPRITSMLQSAREHMKQKPGGKQKPADNRTTSPRIPGFHSLPLSAVSKCQGKLLLQNFPIGYEVMESEHSNSDHSLLLAWKRRPIVAVSAWRSEGIDCPR